MRIVLDTNVYIAAALRGGFAEDILNTLATTQSIITSEEILEELAEKLEAKFKWNLDNINLFLEFVREVCEVVVIKEKVTLIKNDPEDNKILECALAGKADLIVSSDQDLLKLKTFRGIAVLHPKTLTWTLPEYFKKDK